MFELDSDNDIQIHRDRVTPYIADGQLAQGSVGQDNTAVIDTSLPMGQYKLENARMIKSMASITSIPCTWVYLILIVTSQRLVDSNEIMTENKVCSRPRGVGNDILDHKEVDSYTIPAGYDGDACCASNYVCDAYMYITPSRTPHMSLIPELPKTY